MAYIPKNQYSVKYTNGSEFEFTNTAKSYKGYYIETVKGQYFAGEDPQLIKGRLRKINPNIVNNNIVTNTRNNLVYNILQETLYKKQLRNQPIPASTPFPTPEDYQLGFFKRYLSYKRNTKTFKEITQETYNKLLKGQGYDSNLYRAVEIKWVISGDPTNVNLKNLRYYETKFPGITDFFTNLNEYEVESKTENLTSKAGELVYLDGSPFPEGSKYHIHPEKGPMEGAFHVEYPHKSLRFIEVEPNQTKATPQPPTPIPQRPTIINTNPVTSRTSYSPGY